MPRAALYTFKLFTPLRDGTYESSCILMEDLKTEGLTPGQMVEAANALFPFDVLFCNWQPDDGAGYAITQEGQVVRICQDRALGCTYPEDRVKDDKLIIEFHHDNLDATKDSLLKDHSWLFGQITEKRFVTNVERMRLTEKIRLYVLMQALALSEGMPWEDLINLEFIIESRIKNILAYVPYHCYVFVEK